jgi:hypothetical protein
MLALTLRPPHAACVLHLQKRTENREHQRFRYAIGHRIAIHAGQHAAGRGMRDDLLLAVESTMWDAGLSPDVAFCLPVLHGDYTGLGLEEDERLDLSRPVLLQLADERRVPVVTGAVVATAVLGEPYRSRGGPWEADGAVCWPLRELVALREPVPCRGAQGLWALPEEVERLVVAQGGGDAR